ncbi:MAG TPA: hypothetical protein VFG55_07410 [Rhodanobacteraceae bacterium]|nr:hypothetical protein [Rhodanobacteraceae bacterium]
MKSFLRALAISSVLVLLGACGGTKPDLQAPANIPSSFDVTILSADGGLFDYEGAPLTEQDLTSALRYRKEENQPMASIILKRGDKKISKQHVISLARVSYRLGVKAFVDDDGEISEIRAQLKDADASNEPEEKHRKQPEHQR